MSNRIKAVSEEIVKLTHQMNNHKELTELHAIMTRIEVLLTKIEKHLGVAFFFAFLLGNLMFWLLMLQ